MSTHRTRQFRRRAFRHSAYRGRFAVGRWLRRGRVRLALAALGGVFALVVIVVVGPPMGHSQDWAVSEAAPAAGAGQDPGPPPLVEVSPEAEAFLKGVRLTDGKSFDGVVIDDSEIPVDEVGNLLVEEVLEVKEAEPVPPELEKHLIELLEQREIMAEAVAAEGLETRGPVLDPSLSRGMDSGDPNPDRLNMPESSPLSAEPEEPKFVPPVANETLDAEAAASELPVTAELPVTE